MRTILTIIIGVLLFTSVNAQLKTPYLHYTFENNYKDSSGNGFDATAYGTPALTSAIKKYGDYSLYLGGSSSYVKTPTISLTTDNTKGWLVSFYAYTPSSISTDRMIFCAADSVSITDNFSILGMATNLVRPWIANSAYSTISWTAEEWHNIIVYSYYNGTDYVARIWYDGEKANAIDSIMGTTCNYTTRYNIGVDYYINANFVGYIDEFAIWRDLEPTNSQIDSIYTAKYKSSYVPPVSGYNPVAGKHVWFTKGGNRLIPSNDGLDLYPLKKGSGIITDTIRYYIAEDFESWTTTTVQSKDSMERRFPMSWFNHIPADHSIVDVGGNNMWQAYIRDGAKQGFQNYIHLNDTATELCYQMQLYVQPDFDPVGTLGTTGKMPGGFASGNSIYVANDTTTTGRYSIGGRIGEVWGPSTIYFYIMDQYHHPDPYPYASSGQWDIPDGILQTKTMRVNVGTPGNNDGFAEMYIDGVLKAQVTGLKFRSITQGDDYGKLEALWNSYQFGGGGDWFARQDNYIRMDNLLVYTLKPGANSYHHGPRTLGDKIPIYALPQSELSPPDILQDETFTALRDTIYDVGVSYISNPHNKRSSIFKNVSVGSDGISFKFLREEFGYSGTGSTFVRVRSGGNSGTILYTFGLTADGRTNPIDDYYYHINAEDIDDGLITFEIYIGYSNYDNRGIAIEYIRD